MKKYTKLFLGLAALTGLFLLGACGDQSKEQKTNSAASTTVMKDALDHEVKVPTNPKKIIASYLEDYLKALEVEPVAQWTVGGGSKQDYLKLDQPTINYDLPYEEVLKFKPDLLLIDSNSMVEGGKYDQYSKIAPTYVVKNGPEVTWQERLKDVAKVLGKEKKADQVLEDYDQLVKETKETYADQIKGKSIAVLWVTNNSAFMVADNRSSGDLLYDQLGFEEPALTKEISKAATSDWSAVSLEKLAQLDSDYLILVNSDQEAAMFKDPLWQNIPAIKNNHLWEFGPEKSWLYNGPIAYTEMINDVQAKLSAN